MRSARVIVITLALLVIAAGTPASASVLITINKSVQQMTVEVDGQLRWTWPVSTGQLAYDTPSGRYTAFRMEADHFSKEWDDAPMPHSIFFTQQGHAIHGYLDTRNIGRPASHGCVRLTPENAAKLYALVEQQGLPNTKVVLSGDVRVALGRRGLPQTADQSGSITGREPLDNRPYGYAQRYYDRQTDSSYPAPYYYDRQTDTGYRPATGYRSAQPYRDAPSYPYDPPRYPSDYSYRPFPFGR
ncbi:MAG TPA: L,D-transpeptidase [Xanthobacteraceae bacterium]|nr:L,D-transpeptidase [Xanthobacteraceae bacterium]